MDILYKLNNNGKVTFWYAEPYGVKNVSVHYGICNGKNHNDILPISLKTVKADIESKYKAKRKLGYISFDEVKDDLAEGMRPVEDIGNNILVDNIRFNLKLVEYLQKYLPKNLNNNNTGAILPMLAKTYNGNFWKYNSYGLAQWKINGLRCFISAKRTNDIFKPIRLLFQSREGIYWNTLSNLEDYLIEVFKESDILTKMVDEDIILDGELYLPNHPINEINHFVKDNTCKENKLLQFWCYDIAVDNMIQSYRDEIIMNYFYKHFIKFEDISAHYNNNNRFVVLPHIAVDSDEQVFTQRNKFISLGFEGLILRSPNVEYQFGRRRVGYMEKFKDVTDGKFEILAIDKDSRGLPIITCANDINNNTFETTFRGTQESQLKLVNNPQYYIGKQLSINFGERSGLTRVPFHIKDIKLIE